MASLPQLKQEREKLNAFSSACRRLYQALDVKLRRNQLGQGLNAGAGTAVALVGIHTNLALEGGGFQSTYIAEFLSPDFLISLIRFPSHVQNL